MFARRTDWNLQPNRLSLGLQKLKAQGRDVFDLTASNPTRCGLQYKTDEIMAALEKPQVGLDESLKLFEEGIEILRSASAELVSAETKVQMLIEKSNGRFELREMDL